MKIKIRIGHIEVELEEDDIELKKIRKIIKKLQKLEKDGNKGLWEKF